MKGEHGDLIRKRLYKKLRDCSDVQKVRGSILGHFGVMLGSCWGHVGVMLGSCWGLVGVTLGSCFFAASGYGASARPTGSERTKSVEKELKVENWKVASLNKLYPSGV